jgi:hypothetical protein
MFGLSLPTARYVPSFDHHQLEQIQYKMASSVAFFLFVLAHFLPDDGQTNNRNM